MRVEATLPDPRGKQLDEAARELGISRSELINEAVAVFLTALSEHRRGFRLALVNHDEPSTIREVVTPALAQLQWYTQRETLTLPSGDALATALASEGAPEPKLRGLASRRRK